VAHEWTEVEQHGCDSLGFERILRPEHMLTFALKWTLGGNISAVEAMYGARASHAKRTQKLAGRVAVELGLSPDEISVVRYAAVLHDIGKWAIPDAILEQPGKLNESEWEIIRRHPETGAQVLAGVAGFERVRAAVAAHHERFDGRGYPAGLAGRGILVEARLISVADAYDAMTSDRPYRKALSHVQAMEQLDTGAGGQFDPAVVAAAKAVLYDDGGNNAVRGQKAGLRSARKPRIRA
jgi:putative nucleotidyltransferase with HDIG domain